MKLLHKKSKCCGAKIIRFGGRRRQCIVCERTWRVHSAKQGRKASRKQRNYLKKVFHQGFSVKQIALHSKLSVAAIYKRFSKNLNVVVGKKRIIRIRGQKLILVIDAEWQYFKGELWTLYFLSAKSIDSETVVVFDPVLEQGKENAASWNTIMHRLPISIRMRIIAIISDGVRGIETIAINNGWIIQRCHFHLLSMLYKMRGKRASTSGKLIREEICLSVRRALVETSETKLYILSQRLIVLARDDKCPRRMRMAVRDFLRRLPEFRSYLTYPELNLPTTINVMESINSFIRRKSRTVNSPVSWHKWAIACTRFKSKFTCK